MSINASTFFCSNCNIPILNNICEKCYNISTTKFPLKSSPVFQEELEMLSDITGYPLNGFGSLNLWTANRYYYFKGQKIFKLIGGNMFDPPKIEWIKNEKHIFKDLKATRLKIEDEIKNTIKDANKFALGTLEEKAIKFIRETKENLKDKIVWTAISFSGGKDSAVVSHLARKALGNTIIHIFSDTTIEHPSTYDYLDKYQDKEKICLVWARPQNDFMTVVQKAQMPSRIHRWCCSVVKTSPIENLLKKLVVNSKKILTFDGVKHEESKRREDYSPISFETKVLNNIIARPIIGWSTLEEWLYILSENIMINDSYRKGFRRVGCVVCPFSPEYTEFLVDYYSKKDFRLNTLWETFKGLLNRAVRGRVDVPDPKRFLAEGKWKVRAGSFKKNNFVAIKGCLTFEDLFFDLSEEEFQRLKEYLKPIGVVFVEGNYILLLSKDDIQAKFRFEDGYVTVVIYNAKIKSQILKQINKVKFCSNCGLCQTACPKDAITSNCSSYNINADRCTLCGKCIDVSPSGCIIANSLDARIKQHACQS